MNVIRVGGMKTRIYNLVVKRNSRTSVKVNLRQGEGILQSSKRSYDTMRGKQAKSEKLKAKE